MIRYQFLSDDEVAAIGFRRYGSNVKVHNSANIVRPERISLGSNVRIDPFVTISAGEHIAIGSYVHIGGYCYLAGGGGIEMHDFSGLSQGIKIYSISDDYSGDSLTNPTVPREYANARKAKVVLGRHVIVGAGSVIFPGVTIGEGCSVGALTVVNKSLEPWGVYAGTPARKIRDRSQRLLELEQRLLAAGITDP